MRTKTKAPTDRKRLVRNQSSRLGAPIQAIALHSTEGGTLDSVHDMFNVAQNESSSHAGVSQAGVSERWVHDDRKAWTILQLNPVTLNLEMLGFAAQAKSAWKEVQLDEVARWIAFWSLKWDIPIRRGKVRSIAGFPVITKRGVITHAQLTRAGFGTHGDPGANFPINVVLRKARWYAKHGWTTTN